MTNDLSIEQATEIGLHVPLEELMAKAADMCRSAHGNIVTYSPKVFIPLTQLCRDVCHYCTFAKAPRGLSKPYLSIEEVIDIARAGARAGCTEALFTLGDKPELRYSVAAEALRSMGFGSTVEYLAEAARTVLSETGLLPHINAGVLTHDEIARLRGVSVSQGLMLESTSLRLCEKGGPHYGSPDKLPYARIGTLRAAGELDVPMTTGLLFGIGETRVERLETIFAIRDLHRRYGHIQEVIIQNFRAKAGTRMASAPEPDLNDTAWTIAMARLVLGPEMNIQAPPNLSSEGLAHLLEAGINDWGGISPVTIDHVNPEAPWPSLNSLRTKTALAGKSLVPRLPIYPSYNGPRWLSPLVQPMVKRAGDAGGLGREDSWTSGVTVAPPPPLPHPALNKVRSTSIERSVLRSLDGQRLDRSEIASLFSARDGDFRHVIEAADQMRKAVSGDVVTYVVNRNINYTNVCTYRCQFCAFSKGKMSENLRGRPYVVDLEEIVRRSTEAWSRGATEVCLQGGIHPDFTGETYLSIVEAIRTALPAMHIHAFSPLEIWSGAASSNERVANYLKRLVDAGLGTLPGTAAEILDDSVRATLCPDKLTTAQWCEVVETAHRLGLRTTATIMFGHVDTPLDWGTHLLAIRDIQERTGGFTEFVPLPFVAHEAPIYLKGNARKGPTFREAVLMHAVARLTFGNLISNVQTSWVKMGSEGAAVCLKAGANDIGGTLMNESITRSAGAQHGEEMPPEQMDRLAISIGRTVRQRTTLYGEAPAGQISRSYGSQPLARPLSIDAKDYDTSTIARAGRALRHVGHPAAAERLLL
ncbi:5-amino-6-(D-ribitylamino)uracil--L-tyrosine 4-hydroxyphenyl transferase CofH [Aminobacter niigataensis]|uniref:5-amino-6-(D-ribitylamino)uracil--L-tyrosine 4-hydroxyphenyl transferase CofH n=1 Tax=Aminobacter niigataensis TaxID=83265 RepID=UPI0024CAF6A8|nr:5-amino-6-(D-ribitylamino)uracil--L-tyrosine 4-hydroxyphenyl transferase CofH [Aminobacter niigataensis]CAI2931852.1 7,8-didemethyl-8-hydroxy-5-deazariboflavin synthase / 5-amino-6-(D-ribitylamino)uracil--L-tyrosine 4-hydroxyphenyl transferase [Aminobacter niigataensis]